MIPEFLKRPPHPDPAVPVPPPKPPPSPFNETNTHARFWNNQWWAVVYAAPCLKPDVIFRFRPPEECDRIIDHLIAGTIREDVQQVIEGYRAHVLVRPLPFDQLLVKSN